MKILFTKSKGVHKFWSKLYDLLKYINFEAVTGNCMINRDLVDLVCTFRNVQFIQKLYNWPFIRC